MAFSRRDRIIHKGLNAINSLLNVSTLKRISNRRDGTLRVAWARNYNQRLQNLGDALSAVMVSALSGQVSKKEPFKSARERLYAVGTIAHNAYGGVVHVWGSGLDATYNAFDLTQRRYSAPPDTKVHVHATRGPYSRQAFLDAGISAPEVYGDPVWVLPSIFPAAKEKKWDLGVIVHVTELAAHTAEGITKDAFRRYQVPPEWQDRVKIISTLVEPNIDAMMKKIEEITACRRILSTSLHGLVFAESYNIPCLYFGLKGLNSPLTIDLATADNNDDLNHRIRDLYAGMGYNEITVLGHDRMTPTDWAAAIATIDQYWRPSNFDPGPMLDAFPLPLVFDPRRGEPFQNFDVLRQIQF
jgi:hypothetical protein